MKSPGDEAFVDKVRQQLAAHADAVDDLTAARLAQARQRALQAEHAPRRWKPVAGIAAAAAALVLTVLVVMQPVQQENADWEMWVAQDDIEVIEELEFYAWLEATQPNS